MSESEKKSYEQLEAELKETRKRLNSEFNCAAEWECEYLLGLGGLLFADDRKSTSRDDIRNEIKSLVEERNRVFKALLGESSGNQFTSVNEMCAAMLRSDREEKDTELATLRRRVAELEEMLTEARWFVLDFARITHNKDEARCASDLAERIDPVIFKQPAPATEKQG